MAPTLPLAPTPPRPARLFCLASLVLALGACSPAPPPAAERAPELATVEVSAAPDAAYSIADDKVERRANPNAIAGALPDGFPTDIPVYLPSSLVDFTSRRPHLPECRRPRPPMPVAAGDT